MKNWLPPPNAIQLTCNLRLQLQALSTNLGTDVSLGNVVKYLQGLPLLRSHHIGGVDPASNATSERSFSALRRVKTYLSSTMTQCRLNNLMVLHVSGVD